MKSTNRRKSSKVQKTVINPDVINFRLHAKDKTLCKVQRGYLEEACRKVEREMSWQRILKIYGNLGQVTIREVKW